MIKSFLWKSIIRIIYKNCALKNKEPCRKTLCKEILIRTISTRSACSLSWNEFWWLCMLLHRPAGIYLLKVNSRNTRTMCEICSKLTLKTPMVSFWCLFCKLWIYFTPCSCVSIFNLEQVNAGKESTFLSWNSSRVTRVETECFLFTVEFFGMISK